MFLTCLIPGFQENIIAHIYIFLSRSLRFFECVGIKIYCTSCVYTFSGPQYKGQTRSIFHFFYFFLSPKCKDFQ